MCKSWNRIGTGRRDKHTGNHQKYKLVVALFFYIPAEQECIGTHEVRAQLVIENDILRGLGMCRQQAKRARVHTGALLANLRSNNNQ